MELSYFEYKEFFGFANLTSDLTPLKKLLARHSRIN